MRFIFWGGIVMFLGSVALLMANYKNVKIQKEGQIVEMTIEKLPAACVGTRIKHYATFAYESSKFIKTIPAGYCDKHVVGEKVKMKYLEGHNEILYPNESAVRNSGAFAVLAVIGLVMAIKYRNK